MAEQTVKFHLTKIYRKLGVANRTEAARLAYQNGLVESPLDDATEPAAPAAHEGSREKARDVAPRAFSVTWLIQ